MSKLQMLANGKMVATCGLQHCTVTLVPYHDRTGTLQLVGFLLSHD